MPSFSHLVEGPHAWLELAVQPLIAALTGGSAGAETNAGCGLFRDETDTPSAPLRKREEAEAILFKDDRGRRCESTDDER